MSSPPSPPPYADTSLTLPSDVNSSPLDPSQPSQATFAYLLSLLHQPLLLLALDPAVLSVTQSPEVPSLYLIRDSITYLYVFTWSVKATLLDDGILMDGGPGPGVLSTSIRWKVDMRTPEHGVGEEVRPFCGLSIKVDCVPTWAGSLLGNGEAGWQAVNATAMLKRFDAKLVRSGKKGLRRLK